MIFRLPPVRRAVATVAHISWMVSVLCAATAGCDRTPKGPVSGNGDYRATVAVVGPSEQDPIWLALRGGALRYQRDIPSVRVVTAAPAEPSIGARLAKLGELLQSRVDAACIYLSTADVHDANALRAALDSFDTHGAALISIGEPFDHPRIEGHVGINKPEAAELLGRSLASITAPRRSYVLIHSAGRGDADEATRNRFESGAATQLDLVELKDVDLSQVSTAPADAVLDAAGLFPHVGVIVTLDPSVWLGASISWETALRSRSASARYATLSTAPTLWRRLGTPASPGLAAGLVGPLDGDISYAAVRMAVELLGGERRGHRERWMPVELVTPTSVGDFAKRYSAAAGDLDVSTFIPRASATTQPTTAP